MTNRVKMSVMVLLVASSSLAANMPPIEGYTEEALKNNQTLLKSVIKIDTGKFFSKSSCSSALISKNILLTAKHCVAKMAPGTRISLNDNAAYEVVQVLSQPKLSIVQSEPSISADGKTLTQLPLPTKETSTDVALVLFKSSDCSTSTLGGVEPLKLANNEIKPELSNKVLIAGYGLTSPDASDAGTLHAGYNEWVVSDYSTPKDPNMVEMTKSLAKSMGIPDDVLMMMGDRNQMIGFINTAGQKINSAAMNLTKGVQPKGSLPLPGDSGSAAFAFDSKNNPYIVGVTSMAAPSAVPMGAHILVVDPTLKEPLFTADISPSNPFETTEDLTAKAIDDAMAKLIELKYVDKSDNVLKNFGVLRTAGRIAMGTYASVLNTANYPFITKTLAQLEKARDAANYCQ